MVMAWDQILQQSIVLKIYLPIGLKIAAMPNHSVLKMIPMNVVSAPLMIISPMIITMVMDRIVPMSVLDPPLTMIAVSVPVVVLFTNQILIKIAPVNVLAIQILMIAISVSHLKIGTGPRIVPVNVLVKQSSMIVMIVLIHRTLMKHRTVQVFVMVMPILMTVVFVMVWIPIWIVMVIVLVLPLLTLVINVWKVKLAMMKTGHLIVPVSVLVPMKQMTVVSVMITLKMTVPMIQAAVVLNLHPSHIILIQIKTVLVLVKDFYFAWMKYLKAGLTIMMILNQTVPPMIPMIADCVEVVMQRWIVMAFVLVMPLKMIVAFVMTILIMTVKPVIVLLPTIRVY